MTSEEHEARGSLILALYEALGRRISDPGVAMIVASTGNIPYAWLRAACLDLARTWDESQRNPGAPAIFRHATRRAGFVAQRTNYDYFDPTPETVRWWPPAEIPVRGDLAQAWSHRPTPGLAEWVNAVCGGAPLLPPIPARSDSGSRPAALESGE